MSDWVDTILKIGSCFDWITPTINLIDDYKPVGQYHDATSAYNHRDALRRQGIRAKVEVDHWNGVFYVTVKR